ncbi:MAG: hypothetical protein KDK41_11835 [Leptospiraceae bacterium]|nr:hypothetical protein [Leptospiraceae bacterium]
MSDYLFAEESFLTGLARVLDIGGTFNQYNTAPSEELADGIAIASDWQAVGKDIQAGINQYEQAKA